MLWAVVLRRNNRDSSHTIPPSTAVSVIARPNATHECIDLVCYCRGSGRDTSRDVFPRDAVSARFPLCFLQLVSTNNETVIKSVVVDSSEATVFDGESLLMEPRAASNRVSVPVRLPKHQPATLRLRVLVGPRGSSTRFHVFVQEVSLPKFSMFQLHSLGRGARTPHGSVTFAAPDRPGRIALWIEEAFLVHKNDVQCNTEGELRVRFVGLRPRAVRAGSGNGESAGSRSVLDLDARPADNESRGMQVTIRCDEMELAAEVLQDLVAYLRLASLRAEFAFPDAMDEFQAVLRTVEDSNELRMRLSAEMADHANVIKTLVVRAEDARILGDTEGVRRMYAQLMSVNGEMLGEHAKRNANQQQLLHGLRTINTVIQTVAKFKCACPARRLFRLTVFVVDICLLLFVGMCFPARSGHRAIRVRRGMPCGVESQRLHAPHALD